MADSIYQTQKDLVDRLLNNLPTDYQLDQVKLPNAPFNTPKNEKWLRVTTNLAPKENVQASGSYKRQFGIFTIDIFYPKGTGELSALEDFKIISNLYENQTVGNAKCEQCTPVINQAETAWFNIQCDVTFYYEGV